MAHGVDMEIQFLPGVGPKRAELLRKELAVETVGDLLRLYPFRYIDKSSIVRICDARPDMAYLQIRARVMRVDLYGAGGLVNLDTLQPANGTQTGSPTGNQGTQTGSQSFRAGEQEMRASSPGFQTGNQGMQAGNQGMQTGSQNFRAGDQGVQVSSPGFQAGNQSVQTSSQNFRAGDQGVQERAGKLADAKNGSKANALKFNTIRRMSVWISDGTGEMEMVFFKGIKWMYDKLKPGAEFIFFGKPTAFNGRINMVHPEVDAAPAVTAAAPARVTMASPGPGEHGTVPGTGGNMAGTGTGGHGTGPGTGGNMTGTGPGGHGTDPRMGRYGTTSPGAETSPGTELRGTGAAGTGTSGPQVRPEVQGTRMTVQGAIGTGRPGGSMTGVYASTEKLKNAGVTGKVMNKMMEAALDRGLPYIEESLPEYVMKQCGLVPLHYALRNIHFPTDMLALEKAKYRLKFEELFYLQLSLLKQKYIRSRAEQGIAMPKVGEAFNLCYNALPFPLTGAQKRVITEIRNDMKSGHQMNRLLQGDVGSGKTMVAVLTALIAIGNGFQACIMAPTEVLAQQHFKNIQKFLAPTGVKSALLTGSSKASERREVHAGLEDGSIGIIVGTHALIEDNVVFRNLGLAIIDEQHRFGVEQRSKLWRKASCGAPPHVLVMTATPIPRTLAMTLYGDLDVSVIDELPPGRKPVQTIHATEGKRPAMYRFMKEEIAKGRQIFIVYPLINETEKLDYQSLEAGAEEIMQKFPFPDYKTAVVHGKQLNDVKKFNMDAFAEGRADILVATSVIEVGVDVPNASVMIIESAERFGLSQLHQLRGRVGRGSEKSYCVLMTGHKLSKESKHRIELMCATENGFELAEEDMKMRGPGDLEGTQQSGLPISLNIASLAKDGLILNAARDCAEAILKEDPTLSSDRNQLLRKELRKDKYQIKDYSKIS